MIIALSHSSGGTLATATVEAGYRGYFTAADAMRKTFVRAQIEGSFATKLKSHTAPTMLYHRAQGDGQRRSSRRSRCLRTRGPRRAEGSLEFCKQPRWLTGPEELSFEWPVASRLTTAVTPELDRLVLEATVLAE